MQGTTRARGCSAAAAVSGEDRDPASHKCSRLLGTCTPPVPSKPHEFVARSDVQAPLLSILFPVIKPMKMLLTPSMLRSCCCEQTTNPTVRLHTYCVA